MAKTHCTVLTASRSPGIAEGLTYDTGALNLALGSHVHVPLRNRTVEGIVVEIEEAHKAKAYELKAVEKLLGDAPLLTQAQISTLRWMAKHYACSLRQALKVWLPSPPWSALVPDIRTVYRLQESNAPLRGSKQQAIVEELAHRGDLTREEIREATGASSATIKALAERGILFVMQEEAEGERQPLLHIDIEAPKLTPTQQQVTQAMHKDKRPSLLFGITSSGKTEVYAQLIAQCVGSGKQAMLLVPEILLTEHCIERFRSLLPPERIAIVHSRLTPKERRATWVRIHRGGIALVIGSRSALFSPLKHLGLLIIDEEHEWTYKNEQTPHYHARETAQELCRQTGAKLVLGTATPSLESWARAKSAEYHLVRLEERYGSHPLPHVQIVDLAQVKFGSLYPFSPPLLEAIEERLKREEQSVLFLNRRGIASALLCLDCRRRVVSPSSNLPFTLHRGAGGTPYLLDHTSGMQADVPAQCPACGSVRLHAVGAGTQRIEEILARRFPMARLLRADSDTLTHPEQMRLLLKTMRERRADILLGTQSVVKGLDLPQVTLAAVLIADIGLSLPHFRAGERIFDLLTQLTGRSGRAKPGDVIIQTFRPQAPEVRYAAQHRTEEFLNEELKLRMQFGYPPSTQMIRLILRRDALHRARILHVQAETAAHEHRQTVSVTSAPVLASAGVAWHVLLKGDNPSALLPYLDLSDVVVDVDPMECI